MGISIFLSSNRSLTFPMIVARDFVACWIDNLFDGFDGSLGFIEF